MEFKSKTLNTMSSYSWYLQGIIDDKFKGVHFDRINSVDEVLVRLEKDLNNNIALKDKLDNLCSKKRAINYFDNSIGVIKDWKDLTEKEFIYHNQFIDFINEIIAIYNLEKIGFENPILIAENNKKSAEFYINKDNNRWCVEVKTINPPLDEDKKMRLSGCVFRSPKTDKEIQGLKNKIHYHVKNAESKFSYDTENKMLIMFYRPDLESEMRGSNLYDVLGVDYFRDLEKEFDFKIVLF
jgi:hypothetical protein